MSITSKWMRRLIQSIPSQVKQWFGVVLPGMKQRVGDHAFNRIDHAALQVFVQSHSAPRLSTRSFERGLAVIVPCYNHAVYLDATIHCLLNQTYRPFQVVFVEDHSTDETWNRLYNLTSGFPDDITVTCLRTDRNRGQAAAINLGIQQTHASLYTILNDDDYLKHDALEAAITILRDRSQIYLLGAGSQLFDGTNIPPDSDPAKYISATFPNYSAIPFVEYSPSSVLTFKHPNDLNMTHSGTTFFRTVWEAVDGYQPDKDKRIVIFADRDFQLRVASLCPVAVSLKAAFSYWRSGSSVDSGLYS